MIDTGGGVAATIVIKKKNEISGWLLYVTQVSNVTIGGGW